MDLELKTERFQIMVEPSVVRRIEDFRFGNRIASRSEAARRLLLLGLAEQEKAEAATTAPAS